MDAESDKLRKETMLKKYGAGTILDLCIEYHDNDAIHPDVSPENFDRIRKAINNLND